jgi:hypothetical protein
MTFLSQRNESFTRLRHFVERRAPMEHCELCNAELGADHQHLFDPVHRKVACACVSCALLFSAGTGLKYKCVPRRVRHLGSFQITDGQWDSLRIPIEMAFFFHSSPAGRIVAIYPSPAGATESLLSLDTWNDIARDNPELSSMEEDVEALLVNRAGSGHGLSSADYYIVPIDECYKLVGLIRTHWRGFSGGTQVWEEIAHFFTALKERSGREESRA